MTHESSEERTTGVEPTDFSSLPRLESTPEVSPWPRGPSMSLCI